ncbi:MAG: amidohydrolase family protein [Nitrospinota bacterium]|nr:amidohydrolase family protein [Nitrospinota bacterium]
MYNTKDTLQLWTADLVCPVIDLPIRNGAVLTSKGKILAVGEEKFVRPHSNLVTERHFENSILIPGLVNSHTHLELSGIQTLPSKMSDWIPDLVSQIREWPSHLFLSSSRIGTANSISSGVTCVGDISVSGESKTAIVDAGMRGVVFHEFLGINAKEAESIFDKKMDKISKSKNYEGESNEFVRHGLSPHSPYSTSIDLYERTVSYGSSNNWKVATHLLESPEELQFLETGEGPFQEMFKTLQSDIDFFEPFGCSPIEFFNQKGILRKIDLAVHCNQTDENDWRLLRTNGVHVCVCPRSASFFNHQMADILRMRDQGVMLCLGTDSLASSPSLSVLEEAIALREEDSSIEANELLAYCTISGSKALGFENEGVGSIMPGGVADFAVVQVPKDYKYIDLEHLFDKRSVVRCTVINGMIRFEK